MKKGIYFLLDEQIYNLVDELVVKKTVITRKKTERMDILIEALSDLNDKYSKLMGEN